MAKNRGGRKRTRQVGIRELKFPRLLIVTEGTETEINYFQGIKDRIQARYREQIIVEKIDMELEGTGRGTTQVVQAALKRRNRNMYSEVWVLFDKDDFIDFDQAIAQAKQEGMETAWSNRCFELWILLHFEQVFNPFTNEQYISRLNHIFSQQGLCGGSYEKADRSLFWVLEPSLKDAISRSEKLFDLVQQQGIHLSSQSDPATTVHRLVKKLLPYIE